MKAEPFYDGLFFGEGPRWHDGLLWLSDFHDHAVLTVDANGRSEKVVEVPEQPSGLGWLPDGRLLVVSMRDRRVLRREHDGSLVEHANLWGIAPWHCNDMVVDGAGRAYVGNFGFDLDAIERGEPVETRNTVLARVDPDGSVHVAADDMAFPNGSVVTPDGGTLIVAESMAARLTAFDIDPSDGSLSNRRTWARTSPRLADGIALDAEGCVWFASPMTPECVRIAAGGEVLEVVETSQICIACALGGDDGRTLFCITATTSTPDVAAASRMGRIEVARIDVGAAPAPS